MQMQIVQSNFLMAPKDLISIVGSIKVFQFQHIFSYIVLLNNSLSTLKIVMSEVSTADDSWCLNALSLASGLKLNIAECELLPVKECKDTTISGVLVKYNVKYLGTIIEKKSRLSKNSLIELVEQRLNLWLQRDFYW